MKYRIEATLHTWPKRRIRIEELQLEGNEVGWSLIVFDIGHASGSDDIVLVDTWTEKWPDLQAYVSDIDLHKLDWVENHTGDHVSLAEVPSRYQTFLLLPETGPTKIASIAKPFTVVSLNKGLKGLSETMLTIELSYAPYFYVKSPENLHPGWQLAVSAASPSAQSLEQKIWFSDCARALSYVRYHTSEEPRWIDINTNTEVAPEEIEGRSLISQ